MIGWVDDEELYKKNIGEIHPEWAFRIVINKGIPAAIKDGIWEGETALINKNNKREIPVSQVIMSHKSPGGKIEYLSTIMRDITERKEAEEQIKASLKEKEVLLREVHHRVKNNLQIISSLLDMSSMQTQNQETMDLFADSRNRVNAMALIHTQLYRSERFDKINMEEHVQELSKKLLQIYSMEKTIALDIKFANIYLNINQAIPCALVLNELITNACKHAYREGQKGTISISMQKSDDNTFLLRVKDDGAGIPEGVDIGKVKSLGLSLVRNLVYNQLKGKIDVRSNKGTEFLIDFNFKRGEA
jgi:two-component sensor histidine kinase